MLQPFDELLSGNYREGEEIDEEQDESFGARWGWYAALVSLSGDDVRLQEAWLKAKAVHFLNHLSYNKEVADWQQYKQNFNRN